jgi:chromosome segregation ATPase
MSNPSIDQIRGSKAPSVTELVAETRIDLPHSAANTAEFEEAAVAPATDVDSRLDAESLGCDEPASPPPDPEAISQQVQAQAGQLAEHLRHRQQELDHREARLNAWSAQLERDARAARLWLDEQIAALEETAEPAETIVLQEEAIRRMAEALAEKERRLAESESELERQRAALQQFHEQLTADRQLLEEESRARRERLAADHAHQATEIEQKRREVQQRSEQADQAHAALEQFRTELGRMHRETLEIRLATEELWAELSGSAPPAAMTRSLGRIRSRLADHYRMANLELQQKKEELEQLRGQLSQQYEKLVRQKHNFDAWAAECREEVEQQTARLLAQGEDLDRRKAELGEYVRRAQAEKLELQQEIRHLRAKLSGKAEVELPA